MKRLALVLLFAGMFFPGWIGAQWTKGGAPAAKQPRDTHSVTYTYDRLHRLTTVTYSSGTEITYSYDAVGNRTTKMVVARS